MAYHLTVLGHHLTTAQLSHLRPLIVTLVIAVALVLVALWLWMARQSARAGTGHASCPRCCSALATLELIGIHGLAAVWLLWRLASSAFFRRCRQAALTQQQ